MSGLNVEHFVQFTDLFRPPQDNDLALGQQGHIGLRVNDVIPVGFYVTDDGTARLPPEVQVAQGIAIYLIRKILYGHFFQVSGMFPFHGQLIHKGDQVWYHH